MRMTSIGFRGPDSPYKSILKYRTFSLLNNDTCMHTQYTHIGYIYTICVHEYIHLCIHRGHPFMTSTRGGSGSGGGGGGGPAPCGRPHRKLKLESTDVILSSSHAKKLVSFSHNFVF